MNAPLDPSNHPIAEPASLEALWAHWYGETARPFIPALLGRTGYSLDMQWAVADGALERAGWGIWGTNGFLIANEHGDLERSAHETLVVGRYGKVFFDGLEAIVARLCREPHTDFRMAQTHTTVTHGTVKVQFSFETGEGAHWELLHITEVLHKIRGLSKQASA